jgi:putative Ca2+/H+ antiporter (TMEM165/GDT1 family)
MDAILIHAFLMSVLAVTLAETGDKTQIAMVILATRYDSLMGWGL